MVACATVLTSCNNVLDEEGIAECDDRTTVRLTISFGGDGGPMSRDVGNNPAPKDDDLDYTTEEQAEIVAEDIYALVVDASSGKFLYRIKDLQIIDGPASDNYYTRTLEGTMIQTTQPVKIVLLANLIQNNIKVSETTYLDSKAKVEALIDSYDQNNVQTLTTVSTIYNQLIYNYDGTITTDSETKTQVGTGPWSLSNRRIPMWGESQLTTVPPEPGVTLTCYLYRALAKVQIWVNGKQGIDGFEINSITVNNIHTKGYCVSQATTFDEDGPNYDLDGNGTYDVLPYALPSIPDNPGTQNVTYGSVDSPLNVTDAYSDMIYLPEKINKGVNNPVTIIVNYTYNKTLYEGIIRFTEGGVEDQSKAFDIIRNHSYIFNINVSNDAEPAMYYEVINWTSVNNGTLNFGNGNGDVTNPNGNTTIE